MKKVLVVSYHFLPAFNVAVKQFAQYCRWMPAEGWQPIVLSNDWSEGAGNGDDEWGLTYEPSLHAYGENTVEVATVRAAPFDNSLLRLHRALSRSSAPNAPLASRALATPLRNALSAFWYSYSPQPDALAGWIAPAVARGVDLVAQCGVDAVLSNCPPQTNHVVGGEIARRCGIPWIPFFGDLYGFYVGPHDWHETSGRRRRARRRNARWLAGARRALAVSPRMARAIEETYAIESAVVVTGYDPDEFTASAPARGDKLLLSHVGSVYPGDQRPEILFDALDRLLARRPELSSMLHVRLVGSRCDDALRTMLDGRAAATVCSIEPRVSAAEAVAIQQRSHGLLLFNCATPRATTGTLSYPTKIYEYLGARRPILALPSDGDWVDSVMASTCAGRIANTAADAADVIEQWHEQWRAGGHLVYSADPSAVEQFTHRRQTALIARALDACTQRAG